MPLFGRRKPATAFSAGGAGATPPTPLALALTQFEIEGSGTERPDSATTPWSQLRPAIRSLASVVLAPWAQDLVWRQCGDYLAEVCVLDRPDRMEMVTHSTVQGWEGSIDEWFGTARANLRAQMLTAHAVSHEGRVVVSPMLEGPAGYTASWPVCPDALARLLASPRTSNSPGEPVVVMADRDTVYVASSADEDLIESALDTAYTTFTEGTATPISPAAYLATPAGLRPWFGTRPGPLANKALRAVKLMQFLEHKRQYDWLVADDDQHLEEVNEHRERTLLLSGVGGIGFHQDDPTLARTVASIVRVDDGDDHDYLVQPGDDIVLSHTDRLAVPRAVFDEVCGPILQVDRSLPLPTPVLHGWPSEDMLRQLRGASY